MVAPLALATSGSAGSTTTEFCYFWNGVVLRASRGTAKLTGLKLLESANEYLQTPPLPTRAFAEAFWQPISLI
jgi:hypothetical protein